MMNGKPLVIDGYCGLGGWSEGFLAEGWECVGIDIEKHDYGTGGYPGGLILQDMLTVDGRQFKDADCLVFSPPCQKYSYMAMPWTRAKKLAEWYRESSVRIAELNALFDACFRIQLEASKAAGRYIPMVIENVKGAQPWVGSAKWHYGSFYLWGDVPALMPSGKAFKTSGMNWSDRSKHGQDFTRVGGQQSKELQICGGNGTWFGKSHGVEYPGQPGNARDGVKTSQDGIGGYGGDFGWDGSVMRRGNSKSNARKQASAMIAKIPFPLAQYIARVYKPAPLT